MKQLRKVRVVAAIALSLSVFWLSCRCSAGLSELLLFPPWSGYNSASRKERVLALSKYQNISTTTSPRLDLSLQLWNWSSFRKFYIILLYFFFFKFYPKSKYCRVCDLSSLHYIRLLSWSGLARSGQPDWTLFMSKGGREWGEWLNPRKSQWWQNL